MPNIASRLLRWPSNALRSVRSPSTQAELLQVAKSVIAAVLAWILVNDLFELRQPFLAPWTAVLAVHASVYRSFTRGAQTIAASVLGIVLSYVVVQLVGPDAIAMGIVLFVGLLIARAGFEHNEGLTVATTALFVLTSGAQHDEMALLERLLVVGIGVSLGVLVNLLLFPPLNHRSAQQQVDQINRELGDLMAQMAAQLRSPWSDEEADSWITRTQEMDRDLSRAWQLVRYAQEGSLANPRRQRSSTVDPSQYWEVLARLEEGIAQTRSMVRLIRESNGSAQEWDPRFREPWLDLLTETGQRVWDPDADVGQLRDTADAIAADLSGEELPGLLWPLYGTLISNLRIVIDVVDDVATTRLVRG